MNKKEIESGLVNRYGRASAHREIRTAILIAKNEDGNYDERLMARILKRRTEHGDDGMKGCRVSESFMTRFAHRKQVH